MESRVLFAAHVLGSGVDYATIQAAVDAAPAGGAVTVDPGTYAEQVIVYKSLTIDGARAGVDARGNGRPTATNATESVVTGAANAVGQSSAFHILANDVTINGFTISGETSPDPSQGAGIVIAPGQSGTHVINDVIENNVSGLFLSNANSTDSALIQQCYFANNNNAGMNGGRGIYTDGGLSGGNLTNVTIDSNTFINNRGGSGSSTYEAAVAFQAANPGEQSNITLTNNTFSQDGKAALFFNTTGVNFDGNTVTGGLDHGSGIVRFEGNNHDVSIVDNTIYNNTGPGVAVDSKGVPGDSSGFVVNDNNFFDNSTDYTNHLSVVCDFTEYDGSFDARNNYWGSSTGPSGDGPGSGDAVSNGVYGPGNWTATAGGDMLFSPWSSTLITGTVGSITLLTGTTIGTAGSYKNDGNTIAKATDGNLSTFFDGSSANGNWVGIDLGSNGGIVTSVAYASRSEYGGRMNGGIIQASDSSTFATGDVNLYTITGTPGSSSLTTKSFANTTAYRYYRYLSPNGSYGDIAELEFFGAAGGSTPTPPPTEPPSTPGELKGTTIGTTGSYGNDGNTIAKATDGNLSTFFDASSANGNWVGIDLGSTGGIVTSVAYASRSEYGGRMNGGIIQASDSSTFATGDVNLYTITGTPGSSSLTTKSFANTTAYRYYRYLSPNGSYGNIAELEFFGTTGGSTPTPPPAEPPTTPGELTGTTIGTAGSYAHNGNTIAKATDGNLSTFFDGASANGSWVGLDLGGNLSINAIKYAPRLNYADRMVGGEFQISTTADFSSGVTTLYTITAQPVTGSLTTFTLSTPVTAQYVRYLSPNGAYGNISEFAVFG